MYLNVSVRSRLLRAEDGSRSGAFGDLIPFFMLGAYTQAALVGDGKEPNEWPLFRQSRTDGIAVYHCRNTCPTAFLPFTRVAGVMKSSTF